MKYRDDALVVECEGEYVLAIMSRPIEPIALDIGVVIVVGGPQYRVGSHRQFKLLANSLAEAGVTALRFDCRGMGDSTGDLHSFEDITADIGAAVDALLEQAPQLRRIVLWGLCDGASAALIYQHNTGDARVRGLCLVNPWVRSEASLARAQVKHYYTDRLRQKEFWLKLLSGQVAGAAVAGLWRNLKRARVKPATISEKLPYQRLMADAWSRFQGNILLILSGNDLTAKEFLEYAQMDDDWNGLLRQKNVLKYDLADADHTCSDTASSSAVESITLDWTLQHVT